MVNAKRGLWGIAACVGFVLASCGKPNEPGSAKTPGGNVLADHTASERQIAPRVWAGASGEDSEKERERVKELEALRAVLEGKKPYDASLRSDSLASEWKGEKDPVRWYLILCVLHKHDPARAKPLLATLKASSSAVDQRIAEMVESGNYFDAFTLKDPALRRSITPSQIEAAHLDKLAEIANGVFHGTVKYSPEVGDALAKRFYDEENGGSERLAIAKALKKYGHPGYAKVLDWLRSSPEEAYRLLVPALEKPGAETVRPAK